MKSKSVKAIKLLQCTIAASLCAGIFSGDVAAQTPPCCPTPNIVLREQFRGPGFFNKSLKEWYNQDFWPMIEASIEASGNQIVTAIQTQTGMLGGLTNAQSQIAAQGALMQQNAKSSSRYASSEALCRFATFSQGLASADANGDAVKLALHRASIDRQLLKSGTPSGTEVEKVVTRGQSADKAARWQSYANNFCDPTETGLNDKICKNTTASFNRDVNFASTVAEPYSLDIKGGETSPDLRNVAALANNLYGHDVMNNAPNARDLDPAVVGNLGNIRRYMAMRSAVAKRSVAENSFASIVAMKTAGTPATAQYMKNLIIELGLPQAQAEQMAGERPSYFAQMETLTRKLYQSPAFFVNLMENPSNVARQSTAMKSFELMQQRDIYKSMQRSEMLLATLLEIYVAREASGAEKRLIQSGQ